MHPNASICSTFHFHRPIFSFSRTREKVARQGRMRVFSPTAFPPGSPRPRVGVLQCHPMTEQPKLKLIQAGVGGMGRTWWKGPVVNSPDFEVAALVDIADEPLREAGEALEVPEASPL